jgi:hypothetical protein
LDAPDLTQDMGWFGNLFARNFFALKAYIENVETMLLTLKKGGLIQSEAVDPSSNEPLFLLRSDGFLKAIDAVFQNTNIVKGFFSGIEADAMQITGDSSFSGNIDSGGLKVLPSDPKPFSLSHTHNYSQITSFMENVRSALGYPANKNFTVFPTSGAYEFMINGANSVIETIKSIYFNVAPSGPGSYTGIYLISVNNRTAFINTHDGFQYDLSLSFTVGTSARTLRLEGLPPFTGEKNEVYKFDDGQGNFFLKVKG